MKFMPLTAVPAVAFAAMVSLPLHAASLEAPAVEALNAALADEYHAEAFYDAVIRKFGQVRPFANIIEAERTHAQEVIAVMRTYGIAPAANTKLGSKEIADSVPATLEGACEIGVQAEIANRDLYTKLNTAAAGHPDILAVFARLQRASEQDHLPAFERCATGGAGGRGGPKR